MIAEVTIAISDQISDRLSGLSGKGRPSGLPEEAFATLFLLEKNAELPPRVDRNRWLGVPRLRPGAGYLPIFLRRSESTVEGGGFDGHSH